MAEKMYRLIIAVSLLVLASGCKMTPEQRLYWSSYFENLSKPPSELRIQTPSSSGSTYYQEQLAQRRLSENH